MTSSGNRGRSRPSSALADANSADTRSSRRATPWRSQWRWTADGLDLAHLKICFVDAKGRIVVRDDLPPVSVSVEGPARLLALDDGNHRTDIPYDVTERRPFEGHLTAVLRAGCTPGTVIVRCRAEGFGTVERHIGLLMAE